MKKWKLGDRVNLLGHKMEVKNIQNHIGYPLGIKKLYLNCSPHCCTTPLVCKIEITEDHLNEIVTSES